MTSKLKINNDCNDDDLIYNIHSLTHMLDLIADKLLQDKFNLTFNKFMVLMSLENYKNNPNTLVSQKEVSVFSRLTEATVSRIIDDLVKINLVSKSVDKKNRSKNLLEITKTGQNQLYEALKHLEESLNFILQDLDSTEIQLTNKILLKIQNNLRTKYN